jgi:hypothetical protein
MITAPTFTQPLHSGSAAAVTVLVVLGGAMSFVVSGMQTVVVARMVLGDDHISSRQAWRCVLPRLSAMTRAVLILSAFLSVLWGGYFLAGLGIRLVSSTRTTMIFFGIAGILPLIVTCWFVLSFMLFIQVVVLEQAGSVTALRRSWRLMQGYRGRVFGAFIGALVLVGLASFVLDLPFQLAAGALTEDAAHPPLIAVIISIIGKLLVGALALPLLIGAPVLFYVDLRIRKEGMAEALKDALQRPALTASEFIAIWRPPNPLAVRVRYQAVGCGAARTAVTLASIIAGAAVGACSRAR